MANVPPVALNGNHRLLATYLALGYSNEECARELDMSANRIATIKQSSLMAFEVEQERRRIRERITADALGLLQAEAVPSVKRLAELRDQNDNLAVALGGANSILDRVVPKSTRHEEERVLRIVFDADALGEMRDALIEDGVLADVEAACADVEQAALTDLPRALRASLVSTLEDVIVEARAAEGEHT